MQFMRTIIPASLLALLLAVPGFAVDWEKEKAEIEVLSNYLPQAISAKELQRIVGETIAEVGATSRAQMGAVMKALQPKIAGRTDGKTLSAEVVRQLS